MASSKMVERVGISVQQLVDIIAKLRTEEGSYKVVTVYPYGMGLSGKAVFQKINGEWVMTSLQ